MPEWCVECSMQDMGKLKVKAVVNNVPVAMDFVIRLARAVGFGEQLLGQIELAVDEACSNVVDHAYAHIEPGDMEISCHFDGHEFVIGVRDWGKGFDLEKVAEPDVTAPLAERTLGGLGLFLIKQMMDRVQYSSDPVQGNKLEMMKMLEVEGRKVTG